MFDETRYVQSGISVIFPQVLDVAKYNTEIESILVGKYNPAIVVQIPGGFEPALPSLIFQSDHGYSQILVSQVNVILSVTYSLDWQTNAELGKQYLLDRTPLLFEIVNRILRRSASITGITTFAEIPSTVSPDETIDYIAKKTLNKIDTSDVYELSLRLSRVVDNKYFSNTSCDFYRKWSTPNIGPSVIRMSTKSASSYGIRILSELNDRFAFNEVSGYNSSDDAACRLIDLAFEETQMAINQVIKDQ